MYRKTGSHITVEVNQVAIPDESLHGIRSVATPYSTVPRLACSRGPVIVGNQLNYGRGLSLALKGLRVNAMYKMSENVSAPRRGVSKLKCAD